MPLQVFIVTIVLERILSAREKREIIRKLNVVISAFYSEVGTPAIYELSTFVNNIGDLKALLHVDTSWMEKDFKMAAKNIDSFQYEIRCQKGDLESLKKLLLRKRTFLLSMFENTNLLEHDTFTDMLWAVFHIADELESRENLNFLPREDLEHLAIDISRAYQLLAHEWVYYMNHLKKEYPYLYSLAIRKNPFNDSCTVVIHS